MTQFQELLKALGAAGVEFIVVGGVAATFHGSARETTDVDIVYRRSDGNLDRVVEALAPLHPYLRGAPPGLPFSLNTETLKQGLNFTLETDLGDLDLLGEITGGGQYDDLLPHSIETQIAGMTFRCLGIDKLIEVKRAAGRPKDFEAIAELEIIREIQERGGPEAEARRLYDLPDEPG